jgi:hypothetical protein
MIGVFQPRPTRLFTFVSREALADLWPEEHRAFAASPIIAVPSYGGHNRTRGFPLPSTVEDQSVTGPGLSFAQWTNTWMLAQRESGKLAAQASSGPMV